MQLARTPQTPPVQLLPRLADASLQGPNVVRVATQELVGRERQLAQLDAFVADSRPVLHLSGLPGVGKSQLLRAFARRLEARAIDVLMLEGAGPYALEALSEHKGIVCLDSCRFPQGRWLQGERWLASASVAAAHTKVVCASSLPLAPDPCFSGKLARLALPPLDESHARALLARYGIAGSAADSVVALAHGIPWLLKLAAETMQSDLRRPYRWLEHPAALRAALTRFAIRPERGFRWSALVHCARHPGPVNRAGLECSGIADASRALSWLATCPYVRVEQEGVVVNDAVRALILGYEQWAKGPVPKTRAPVSDVAPKRFAPLERRAFELAVDHALKHLHDSVRLSENPLLDMALSSVAAPCADRRKAAQALVHIVSDACAALGCEGRDAQARTLLLETYVRVQQKQLAVSLDLGMGYSTYRRHLRHARKLLAAELWAREQAARAKTESYLAQSASVVGAG